MKHFPYCRPLAVAACVLLASPGWGADDPVEPPPSPDAADAPAAETVNVAGLIESGRFEEAIVALRPLLRQEPVDPNVLYLYGLASLEASQRPGRAADERELLLDEAIAAFHTMLVAEPGLVRVRLELARAFFLKGEDDLARRHFEHVLAGGVPEAVAANVQRFLDEIRARGRWSFNLGAALAPDTNIGAGSDARTIYIFGLPFERDAQELTTSGIGVALWGGAEYQVPLAERWRLRAGGEAARREYGGSQFDQLYLSTHVGPRWFIDERTDASLLVSARQRWYGPAPDHRELGARFEMGRRVSPRVSVLGRASWHERRYRTRTYLDGPVMDAALRGFLDSDAHGAGEFLGGLRAGASREPARAQPQPLAGRGGHGDPSVGFHGGWRRRSTLDRLRGRVVPPYPAWRGPGGSDAQPAPLDPQPGLHCSRIQSATGGHRGGAGNQRPALRLPTHPGRASFRAPVLGTGWLERQRSRSSSAGDAVVLSRMADLPAAP